MKSNLDPHITAYLAKELVKEQFPHWSHLEIKPVKFMGHDNRAFRLGSEMLVRMPSAARYATKVEKEQKWLPFLSKHLSLAIPKPIAMGSKSENYPFNWSIYEWIDGESANSITLSDQELEQLALDLANFLNELHRIDTKGAPVPGEHNFFRGANLSVYDLETKQAIKKLGHLIDAVKATSLWERAVSTKWEFVPVWIHGDIATGNILIKDGRLSAVIDFSAVAIGDPACDLVIAFTLFSGKSRQIFIDNLKLDENTWERARGWALWKALITLAKIDDIKSEEADTQKKLIAQLAEHKKGRQRKIGLLQGKIKISAEFDDGLPDII